jgi:CSLREA domain-containing protein
MRTKSHAAGVARRFRPGVELLEDRCTPAMLPIGFQESIVATGISGATAMEISPDGRIWVLEQGGEVEVFHTGSTASFKALDLPAASINSVGERGLLGIAFDPSYNIGDAAPDFVYLYYTSTAAPNPHNRISRFTVDNTNPDQPTLGSELVIFELDPLNAANHNGGAIHFGPDGKLYAAVGDNANGANAQALTTLHGKMLRLNADGSIPTDNPFFGVTTGKNQAIWARGLRNPFTFTFQPGTGRMHINDVGQNTWEEINVGAAGANYGWPATEGNFNQSQFPNFTRPFYSYSHGSGTFQGFAITGGAFYNPSSPGANSFPPSFEGDYFFADFVNNWINVIDVSTGAVARFATNAPGTVDVRVAPDGSLLYLARNTGRVQRVIFTAVITVNTTVDEDNGLGVGGVSLREAIKAANLTAASDIINFNIPGSGPHTISLTSPLPALTTRMTINGNTQPDIILSGLNAGAGTNGLVMKAAGSLVRGLTINSFQGNGVLVLGANNVVEGCRIGASVDGLSAVPNQLHGIMIAGTATGVRIGGTAPGAGNVISGNGLAGVALHGPSVKNNIVQGNRIGTNTLGSAALGNGYVGVLISGGADTNTIGGPLAAARNIISGNNSSGVEISGVGTTGNIVAGNAIGLDILGSTPIGNAGDGVVIKDGAASNRVGGGATSRNVISGNLNGVNVFGAGTTLNVISGNYIGTDLDGAAAIGNSVAGVRIGTQATNNMVGGMTAGTGNVISGNSTGIVIGGAGVTGNKAQGNFIGVNAAGTSGLANVLEGVTLSLGAKNTLIGGTVPGTRNIISGNGTSGVLLSGLDTTGNLIQGNFIGTDVTGNLDLGNVVHGVKILLNAMNNTIGGAVAGARNVISGNNGNGVHIENSSNNRVQGNYIGTNAAGAASLPNANGVNLLSAAINTIGGTIAGVRNVISGNTANGVAMTGLGATANLVQGNFIGTNAAGTGDVGNGSSGVAILDDATANTIGGTVAAARNIISGNDQSGVRISDSGAELNVVRGNFIGLAVNGTSPLGNSLSGVFITSDAANNRIGGTVAGAGNTIAHNGGDGVLIGSDPANGFNDAAGIGNTVQVNRIFSNGDQGIDLGANDGPTPNETDDVDAGPNGLLNTPVLTSAFLAGANLILTGFINTSFFTAWRIEFFASPPSGQGQSFLGSLTGNMGESTTASFATVLTVPATVLAGHKLTATMTDELGNTSEFSIPLTIE